MLEELKNFYTVEEFMLIYKKLYKFVNSRTNIPNKILEFQRELFNVLSKIEVEKKLETELRKKYSADKFVHLPNYYYFEVLYRGLMDFAIYKHICKGEKMVFQCLATKPQENKSNYNLSNIERYIEYIEKKDKKHSPKRISLIVDFALAHLECGDILFKENKKVGYYDIKEGKINSKIIDKETKGEEFIPNSDSEEKQYIRFKKQKKKWGIIDKQLEIPGFNQESGALTIPYNIKGKRFSNLIKKELNRENVKKYKKVDVDDCISIEIINYKNISKIERFVSGGLGLFEAFPKLKEISDPEKIEEYLQKIMKEYTDILEIINKNSEKEFSFLLNDNVGNPYLTPLYCNGVNIKEMEKIIKGEIIVFINIDIEKLLQQIRSWGFKLYPKKGPREDGFFWYNNKRYILEKNGKKTLLGETFIQRIIGDLYTTQLLEDFFKKYLLKVMNL